jgi:hypothetical protein
MATSSDLSTLLERLLEAEVEFVLVGGLAAVVQGAPITTFDVDIVHRRTPDNVDRLLALLAQVGARYRGRPEPSLPPSREVLQGPGHSLLMTDLGPLDVLGAIENGAGYDQIAAEALVVTISGRSLKVLSLETIVSLKQGSTDLKDKLRLPILQALLRRKQGG